jgi:hypothetical protein
MLSAVELRRIVSEWRLRLQRVQAILNPPAWNENEWRQFSQAVTLLVRDHGTSWAIADKLYWDLRWHLQGGGELIAQVEHLPDQKTTLIVAQTGGFANDDGSYTWLWAEFDLGGEFARDPYWVEGTWKEALTSLLMPLQKQAAYYLAAPAQTPEALLLQDGARPNTERTMILGEGDPALNPDHLPEDYYEIPAAEPAPENGTQVVPEPESEPAPTQYAEAVVPAEAEPVVVSSDDPAAEPDAAPIDNREWVS